MKKTIVKKLNGNKGYYIPMFNMKGFVSSLTPFFAGDLNNGYHNYAIEPNSAHDLFNLTDKRNMIFLIDNVRYDLNGQQQVQQNDEVVLEIKQLTQKVIRTNSLIELTSVSFVPVDDTFEVHNIKLRNNSNKQIEVKAYTSILLYSRSPDNIHDHRHVTSLLNRVSIVENGIINNPSLTFDERGHKLNDKYYSVFAFNDSTKVSNYVPTFDEYVNEGSMLYPRGLDSTKYNVEDSIDGYEAMGTIGFETIVLKPNEETNFTVLIGIHEDYSTMIKEANKYKLDSNSKLELEKSLNYFDTISSYIDFEINSEDRIKQLNWIKLQPILRRFLGNSFLPHHDYGHGGRGWRDLWQDLLSLIYSGDSSVRSNIIDNFKGVRIDGSNATIIGNNPGEFIADRNNIVRVWSDHGSWPLLTTKLYIDETGDIDILLVKQTYYDDQFTHYTRKIKKHFEIDNILKLNNKVYESSILEHLILQNVIGFLNTGINGFTRTEDGDWNDGLDMGSKLGETIPFTFFYLNNLRVLTELINKLDVSKLELTKPLYDLILGNIELKEYFNNILSDEIEILLVDKDIITARFNVLVNEKLKLIEDTAIINGTHYQSYVNNEGTYLDNEKTVSLTSQTMSLINSIASNEQANKIAQKTKEKLFDKNIGGYRLNNNYDEILLNMGRAFGFAYGHKENGAVFSHMTVMYTYGLYKYNLVKFGEESISTLLDQALKEDSNVIAGIPEYFSESGIGMYPFLTGSSSWVIKLLRDQVFGIQMDYGVLHLNPKLSKNDFINNKASVTTIIHNKKVKITYLNEKNLDFNNYYISKIIMNDLEVENGIDKVDGNIEVILDEINRKI